MFLFVFSAADRIELKVLKDQEKVQRPVFLFGGGGGEIKLKKRTKELFITLKTLIKHRKQRARNYDILWNFEIYISKILLHTRVAIFNLLLLT